MGIFQKIFGTYSQREIKKIIPLVDKIESYEEEYKKYSDEELTKKTEEFKSRISNGETLDDILPEAFATVREASARVLNMRHFRVQLIGGIVLHQGRIAEMKTGEGKTLVATLPVYLNALTSKGVHVVTVNDYLASRDSIWMGKLYKFLGLSVGLVVAGMSADDKRKAYACDITYGTNNEFGFDYLRDNMAMSKEAMVQRELNYAIVDEIDSILIDEARTPLIISGMVNKQTDLYTKANSFARGLKAKVIVENNDKIFDESDNDFDYVVDLKAHTAALTDRGTKKAEAYFKIEDLSDINNLAISHHINQALRAYGIMQKDKDYIVRDGEVLIVDEFTGRIMIGRRYSDGLHQAIEAKENVKIAAESQTLASITFQNYFRLYSKLAGMTGTAKTEEEEFKGIYKLDVVEIPTNKEIRRIDLNDVVYKNEKGKFNAIIEEVKESYKKGQPVLVGTVSIEKSEILSSMLKKEKIPHQVLNAKFHKEEAEIIAQAGKFKQVTIATNMAGRGTDIMLGGNIDFAIKSELKKQGFSDDVIEKAVTPLNYDDEQVIKAKNEIEKLEEKLKPVFEEEKKKVIDVGGLRIIGSERHESRRIDNQLRGRSGRQGDVGVTRFYISLQDDLMRLFGNDRLMNMVDALGLPDDMPLEQKMLTSAIETAQKRVEGRNYSIRKNVLEYDDVMNTQRNIIYSQRKEVLEAQSIKDIVLKLAQEKINEVVSTYFSNVDTVDSIDFESANLMLKNEFFVDNIISKDDIEELDDNLINEIISKKIEDIYVKKHEEAKKDGSEDVLNMIERQVILKEINEKWMDHIDAIENLKSGINLRAYGQTNPVEAYKIESFDMFEELISAIKNDATKAVFSLKKQENASVDVKVNISNIKTNDSSAAKTPRKVDKKIGRNDPCPCGSGKKYKNCCGKNA